MEGSNGSRGFNADERAERREAGPVVLGGKTYHPARLTNKRLRQVRQLARAAGREAEKVGRESTDYQEAYDDAVKIGKTDEEATKIATEAGLGSDAVDELNTLSLMEQLPILLVDDNQQPISVDAVQEHLESDLDARDVGDLMGYLLGAPDPSEKTSTT